MSWGSFTKTVEKVFIQYQKTNKNEIFAINFRKNDNGWKKINFFIKSNFNVINENYNRNSYMKMFLSNYSLRTFCYAYNEKENGSKADIILGDFWEINNIVPEFNDKLGVSAIVINTDKGAKLYDCIKSNLDDINIGFNDIVKYNCSIRYSVNVPIKMASFFADINLLSYKDLYNKYLKENTIITISKRIVSIIKYFVHKNSHIIKFH